MPARTRREAFLAQKTVQIVMLAIFSYWMGSLDAGTAHSTRYWVMAVVYITGIAGFLFLLLRDIWKPNE
jgi:hypothetical protein